MDPNNSKQTQGAVFPENATETQRKYLEGLITPSQVRTRFLFGIPLHSPFIDPVTRERAKLTEDQISDIINGCVDRAEEDLKIDIFPVNRTQKEAFDINMYAALGYFQLSHRPASSLVKLSVTPSNDRDVYVVPLDWVEANYLTRGQINIIPLTVAFVQGTYIPQQSSGGAAFLQILGNKAWIPAWWQVQYVSGFPNGSIPRVVNDYIGILAAMEILSMLGALYRVNSHSLGADGLSQSVSGPGPAIYGPRLTQLEEQRRRLMGEIRSLYGFRIMVGTL